MLMGRYGTFAGGIDLPDEKQTTLNRAIEPYRPAGNLCVPLGGFGPHADPTVEPGQLVQANQQIAAIPGGRGFGVYSPVSGRVVALTKVQLAARERFTPSPAVEIEPDGEPFEMEHPRGKFDFQTANRASLLELIAASSLSTYRRPLEPLIRWIERARARRCATLIANCMENQPYVTADHRLLVEYGREVVTGLGILAKTIGAREIILAVDSRRTADYQQILEPARKYGITRIALPHKYPTGADAILVKVLTRREVPPGGSTIDVGVAVINAATALATFRWVICQLPPTGRVVTFAGPHAPQAGNFWVPFGSRCSDLLGDVPHGIIHNGPMLALRCPDDAVVTASTDVILAMDASDPPVPSPCIRCSWCTDHCPVRLNVAALNDAFELGLIDRARKLVALGCVECGVCTYVCPARLPLTKRVKQLKRAISNLAHAMPLFTPP